MVKKEIVEKRKKHEEKIPAKRVDFVSVKLIRERSILYKNRTVGNPQDAYELAKEMLEDEDREKLLACFLDTKNQPVALHVVSIGSLNSSIIHPREIFKAAVLSNAASIILYHNHPSGNPTPSLEDYSATERLQECGKLIGIDLLDHIIIGNEVYYSMREKGDMK